MRNPNGYGSVVKLPGKRRKPFAVRVTASFALDADNERLTQKYKYLGYYAKRVDAMKALADYNADPYDLDTRGLTLGEVYDLWSAQHYKHISPATASNYEAARKVIEPLANKSMRDLRLVHLQRALDSSGKRKSAQNVARQLLHQLFEWAIKNDVVEKNYASYITLENAAPSIANAHTAFTDAEISALWASLDLHPAVDTILILIYTGLRIGELLELTPDAVDPALAYLDVRRSKTASGVRRVPIADKIKPLLAARLSLARSRVIATEDGRPCTYQHYLTMMWRPALATVALGDHKPHDTRHTTVSLLSAAAVRPELIRAIVGHKGPTLTEKVYTHFELSTLAEAINKI